VVGLCSNDYLGLADEIRAPVAAAGAGGSRLICGDLPGHRAVERALASLVGSEDAVLFPSGYQLNLGVLPALITREDVACSDALNHASLIDGLRLARADVRILPHRGDTDGIAHPQGDAALWWITESTFSMDGDTVDLVALQRHLARGGEAYVDEAHALGLYSNGRGLLGEHGIVPSVLVGTLGKSFGAAGAFVAATQAVCSWIRSRARSFVFSTGMSPAVVDAIAIAIERVRSADGDLRRKRLWSAVAHVARRLGVEHAPSPILPIVIGDNRTTLTIAQALLERGWHVQPIRPPTVPSGTARLRITLSAGHDLATLDSFIDDLLELLAQADLPLVVARGLGDPDATRP
jgi:8-amino-7-oxononanoate synthase